MIVHVALSGRTLQASGQGKCGHLPLKGKLALLLLFFLKKPEATACNGISKKFIRMVQSPGSLMPF